MIFSVSSICLAYVLGILVSTIYVRKLCLVGAGFFWMMTATNSVLAFFAVISTSGFIGMLCVLTFISSLIDLGYVVVWRAHMREKSIDVENIITAFLLLCVLLTILAIAHKDFSGWSFVRQSTQLAVGGLLLGGVTSAMLLGHWYLVQPGLTRKPINFMTKVCMVLLGVDIFLWLLPNAMFSVLRGSISDGWGGTLGYMWVGACITTAVLLFVARKALQEKSYSAVMATTGLLYLAILMANGVELIPRAILS